MFESRKVLALVPARKGSKRLPGKNLLTCAGQSLLAWTVKAAQDCLAIDEIVVTTDDPEIRSVAKELGASVPFLRHDSLATDQTPMSDVVLDALEKVQGFDLVILLQPTSPLRESQDIQQALQLLKDKKAHSVVSVTDLEKPLSWVYDLQADLSLRPLNLKEKGHTVRPNGAIYLFEREFFLREKKFLIEGTRAYLMPQDRSIDIDTPLDFSVAEILLRQRLAGVGLKKGNPK